jgi:hypothetical protein
MWIYNGNKAARVWFHGPKQTDSEERREAHILIKTDNNRYGWRRDMNSLTKRLKRRPFTII